MKKVKLGLWHMPVPFLIQFCNLVVQMMTGNLYFLTPNPKLADVSAAIMALQTAYDAALPGGKTLKTTQRLNKLALLNLMTRLGAYVQEVSNGDEAIIISSGMGIQSSKSTAPVPGQVENLRFVNNLNTGEASLLWNAIQKKNGYKLQTTVTPLVEASWADAGLSTKRSISVKGLTIGQVCWFRVAAFNAAGLGNWSLPAPKMIG